MDKDRDEKLHAGVNGLRAGLPELSMPVPPDVTLTAYAAYVINGLESDGFKIVRRDLA